MSLLRSQNKKFEEKLKQQLEDLEYKPSESLWKKIASEIPADGFENTFAENVNSFQPKTNAETWNKIEPRLPDQNKINFRYVYWIPLLLLLTGLAAYFAYQLKEPVQQAGSRQVGVAREKHDERLKGSQQVGGGQAAVGREKQNEQLKQRDELKIKNKINKDKVDQPSQLTKSKNTSDKKKIASKNTVDRKNDIMQNKNVFALNKHKETSPDLNPAHKSIPLAKIDAEKEVSTNDNPMQQTMPVVVSQVTYPTTGLINTTIQEQKNDAPSAENKQKNDPSFSNEKTVANDSTIQKNIAKNKTNDDQLTAFSISIISGMHYCYNVLSAPSVSSINFDENISLRRKIESPSLDWSGAFLLDYAINEKWRISSGVMVSNFSQEFRYSIASPSGNHQSVNDPAAKFSNQNDSIVGGNSYNNLIKYTWTEIPLFITYSFQHKNKIGIEIMTGMSYAIVSGVNAAYVSYDNVGVLVLNDKNGFPGVKNNFFFHFDPIVSYRLNEMVSLGLAPTFKYSITSITGNDNWVQQHPYFFGISATLRKKF